MDAVTGQHNVKHGVGAVGILTAGLVTRQGAYETLVAYALCRSSARGRSAADVRRVPASAGARQPGERVPLLSAGGHRTPRTCTRRRATG